MSSPVLTLTAGMLKYLEIREEEALVGTIKFGRVRKEKDKEDKGSRFQIAPNFGFPTACDERPVSANGRITIHFKQLQVVKKAKYKGEKGGKGATDLVIKGDKDTREVITSSSKGPSDHDSYISREEAVMTITAARFEGYMAAGKLEQGQKAVISNISDDPNKRRDFWDAVVRRERKPSPDVITLYPDRLTMAEWSTVGAGLERGHPLKQLITAVVRACLLMETAGVDPAPVSLEIDGRHFPELCSRLNEVTELDRSNLPASIWRGRGGRVQRRFVGELPAGISEEARLKIAVAFAEYLGSLGMMYTVVIHAPDAHNHKKNFHLHAVAYDRPCRFLEEHGCWDFDYAVPVSGKPDRFPFRQKKPGNLTRSSDGRGDFRKYGAVQMAEFRRVFTELCNKQLRLTPFNYLYDHRSYKVLRIYQKPQKHLGTKAASLAAVGVPTNASIENAESSWQGAFSRARAAHRIRLQVRKDCRTEASVMLARFRELEGEAALTGRLAGEIDRLDALTDELGNHELHIENLRLTLNMVFSSAEKTEETCKRLLETIEDGSAKPSEFAIEGAIRERLRETETWQDGIDEAEGENLRQADEFAAVIRNKTRELERTMENIRDCLDSMEAQIIRRVPTFKSEDAPSEKTGPAPKKVDARSRRIQAYYDAPLDYEESWDRVFSRIQYEELEIKSPSSETQVFHVPGISREELDLLLNPFFQKRSQARLVQMHKYRELNRQRSEDRQAAKEALHVDGVEGSTGEAEASRSIDRAVEQLQRAVVPETGPTAGEGTREQREPTDSSVQAGSDEDGSKDFQPDNVGASAAGNDDKAEQPNVTDDAQSGMSRVRDAFEDKLSRGPKKRPDNPLRRLAREIAGGMTSEDSEAAVSGVAKIKPEVGNVDRDATSVEPASNLGHPAGEPQHLPRETEESPTSKDEMPGSPSQSNDGGMTPEQQWEWLKNGGRGR